MLSIIASIFILALFGVVILFVAGLAISVCKILLNMIPKGTNPPAAYNANQLPRRAAVNLSSYMAILSGAKEVVLRR